MRKVLILALLVAVALTAGLVACGEKETSTTAAPVTTAGPTTSAAPSTTAAPTTATSAAGPTKEKITIGYVDAFTGSFAPGPQLWGTIWMETLIADYNAQGGLYVPEYGKKLPIELIKYDSTSDTETLIRLTEKAMTEDKVDLMFAPWGTSQNFAVYPLYEKHEYPFIAHAMGTGQLVDLIHSGGAAWAFPVLCQPPFVAKYTADFIQWAKPTTIGIIGVNDLHGIEFTGNLKSELSSRNIPVAVGPELYPPTVSDLSPIIKKLQEAKVDCLWASTYPADGTLLVKQMMELGYSPKVMFMGPGSQYPLVMVPTFGLEALKGIMEYHGFEVDFYTKPELMSLAEKYKAAAGGWPGPNTVAAYVCYQVLFEAVQQVGLDRTKLRDALKTGTFKTVLGDAKWNWDDCYLDVPGAGYLCQWQGKDMLQVVWPLDRKSADWMPKPPWPAK